MARAKNCGGGGRRQRCLGAAAAAGPAAAPAGRAPGSPPRTMSSTGGEQPSSDSRSHTACGATMPSSTAQPSATCGTCRRQLLAAGDGGCACCGRLRSPAAVACCGRRLRLPAAVPCCGCRQCPCRLPAEPRTTHRVCAAWRADGGVLRSPNEASPPAPPLQAQVLSLGGRRARHAAGAAGGCWVPSGHPSRPAPATPLQRGVGAGQRQEEHRGGLNSASLRPHSAPAHVATTRPLHAPACPPACPPACAAPSCEQLTALLREEAASHRCGAA